MKGQGEIMKYKVSDKSIELSQLAIRYKNGDKTIEDKFFKELHKYLYAICKGNVLRQDLNDVISEIMVQILKVLPKYDESKSQFTTFIQYRIIDSIININKQNEQPGFYIPKLSQSIIKNPKFIEYQYSTEKKDYVSLIHKIKQLYPNLSQTQIIHTITSIYNYLYNQKRIKVPEENRMSLETMPTEKTTEDIVMENETKDFTYKCLSLIEPDLRIPVMKIYGIGYDKETITKVAKDIGISRPALTQRINAAFAKVRDLIEFEQIASQVKKGFIFTGIITFILLFLK